MFSYELIFLFFLFFFFLLGFARIMNITTNTLVYAS